MIVLGKYGGHFGALKPLECMHIPKLIENVHYVGNCLLIFIVLHSDCL